tara:strand:+ start:5926 stop:6282 length:357 start_codon:yes stop_codon:yes gene_type:complete
MSKVIDKEFSRETDGKSDNVPVVTEKDYKRGKHPNSQANLEPWEKGESGNPSGRPKKYVKLKKALDKVGKNKKDAWDLAPTKENYKDEVLDRIWYEASNGSVAHIRMLAEIGCLDEED